MRSKARGIGTGVSYEALHLCTLGRQYGGREGQFPNAERISRETVTLPLHAAHDGRRRRPRLRRGGGSHRRRSEMRAEMHADERFRAEAVGRHSRLQRGAGLQALFDRLYPALDKLGMLL